MIHRFEIADDMTPAGGTTISEWMRLADLSSDGCTVHEVRNVLACLMGIRFEASDGWTPELRASDARCENQLWAILRGLRLERRFGCDVPQQLVAAL